MTLDLVLVTDVRILDYSRVPIIQILTKLVRFDRNRDHSVLHVILPKGGTLGHLLVWLIGFLSREDLVKLKRLDSWFGLKATVPIVIRDMLDLQMTSLLRRLLDLLLQAHF